MNAVLVLFLLATAFNICSSFTAIPVTHVSSSTVCYLVPEQGCQLKAAWEAASASLQEQDKESSSFMDQNISPTGVAQSFVSRLFSLPSSLLHPHSSETAVKDVVYYPVVGFHYTLLSSKPLPSKPFPTAASCRIPVPPSEPLYGWFSPACSLNHPDSDEYVQQPRTK